MRLVNSTNLALGSNYLGFHPHPLLDPPLLDFNLLHLDCPTHLVRLNFPIPNLNLDLLHHHHHHHPATLRSLALVGHLIIHVILLVINPHILIQLHRIQTAFKVNVHPHHLLKPHELLTHFLEYSYPQLCRFIIPQGYYANLPSFLVILTDSFVSRKFIEQSTRTAD